MAESDKQAERAQKAAKPQKAQKTNAKAGANKAKAKQEEEALLRADTFTNAPKVSRRTLTKEEREAIAKQREADARSRENRQRLFQRPSWPLVGSPAIRTG